MQFRSAYTWKICKSYQNAICYPLFQKEVISILNCQIFQIRFPFPDSTFLIGIMLMIGNVTSSQSAEIHFSYDKND